MPDVNDLQKQFYSRYVSFSGSITDLANVFYTNLLAVVDGVVAITAGTINGAIIGGTAPAVASFTAIKVTEGVNASQGVTTLVAGTITVSNTAVTATSRIFIAAQLDGGTVGFIRVSSRVAGTSFTITSSNALDTSTVAYEIFQPA